MHLLLLSELIAALRANDPGTFKQWLAGERKILANTQSQN